MTDDKSNTWRDMRRVRVPTAAEMDEQIEKDISPSTWEDGWIAALSRAKREVGR